jgi:hypothetical protein
MNNYKNLYKLIDGLNNKIKNLELCQEKNQNNNTNKNNHTNKQQKEESKNILASKIESYRIQSSNEIVSTKKYIGLMFDSNFNNFETDENSGNKNLSTFIKLPKSNIIINYLIQLELNYTPLSSTICSIALGIRSKTDYKIKIIKGTRQIFDITNCHVILGTINLTNTTIYMSEGDEELCMIADLGSVCKVNPRKSLIKLLYFY